MPDKGGIRDFKASKSNNDDMKEWGGGRGIRSRKLVGDLNT
jgi:hypothetical protein